MESVWYERNRKSRCSKSDLGSEQLRTCRQERYSHSRIRVMVLMPVRYFLFDPPTQVCVPTPSSRKGMPGFHRPTLHTLSPLPVHGPGYRGELRLLRRALPDAVD